MRRSFTTRRRFNNRGEPSVLCEPLEQRQLLAFAIADYFPLTDGASWHYSGMANGQAKAWTTTSMAGVLQDGMATTVQSETSNEGFTQASYYHLSSTGLRLLRQDNFMTTPPGNVRLYANGGAQVSPAFVTAGQVVSVSWLSSFDGGASGFGAGTTAFSGTVTFSGPEQIATPAGTFMAIKMVLSGIGSVDLSNPALSDSTSTETKSTWLAQGLGVVREDFSGHFSYSDGTEFDSTRVLSLTSVSLLGVNVALFGGGHPIANGDSTPRTADGTNFGGLDVAGPARTRRFNIRNTGSGQLNIGSVTLSGANAGDFNVVRMPVASVGQGQSTFFKVRFNPTAQGLRRAVVTISHSDPLASPFTFSIEGNGLLFGVIGVRRSDKQLTINNGSIAAVTADGTSVGNRLAAGQAFIDRTFIVSNLGLGVLAIAGTPRVRIAGAAATDFTIVSDIASGVIPGSFATFTIRFDPSLTGRRAATISIMSSDRESPLFTFVIAGRGK